MNEEIVAFLRESPHGVSPTAIAERFLKFRNPPAPLAARSVRAMLDKDVRCILGEDGLWRVRAASAPPGSTSLADAPWAAVSLLANGSQAFHVAIWSVLPKPELLLAGWLADPSALSHDDRALLVGPGDAPFDKEKTDALLGACAEALSERTAVYASGREQSLLAYLCGRVGEALSEEAVPLSQLCAAAQVAVAKPMTFENLCRALLFSEPPAVCAAKRGELLAQCLAEALSLLPRQGIESLEQLQDHLDRSVQAFDFSGKLFSAADIAALPQRPGVYGFKDVKDTHLYIGKSTNLRRRICSYFRDSDESPGKLERLKRESTSLTTHLCGSELECLVLEYRLIAKHAPALNSQLSVNERRGSYRPVPDCMILLPHIDANQGMSFWFKQGQRTSMRPFATDFSEEVALLKDISSFFFSHKLAPQATDFPEQEIASRWVARHADDLIIVPVHRMASAEEVLDSMKSYWPDVVRM